jgi:hypothetical protein
MLRVKLLLAVAMVFVMSAAAYAAPRTTGKAHHGRAGQKAICKHLGGKQTVRAGLWQGRGGKGLAAHRAVMRHGRGGKALAGHRAGLRKGLHVAWRGGHGHGRHLGKGPAHFRHGYAMHGARGGTHRYGYFGRTWRRG